MLVDIKGQCTDLQHFSVKKCGVSFSRKDNYMRHIKNHPSFHTRKENSIASHYNANTPLIMQEGKGTNQKEESKDVTTNDCLTEEEVIEGNLKKITILAEDQTKHDPMAFLKSKEDTIKSTLREALKKRLRIKFYLTLQFRFNKIKGDQVQTTAPFFHGKCHIVLKRKILTSL